MKISGRLLAGVWMVLAATLAAPVPAAAQDSADAPAADMPAQDAPATDMPASDGPPAESDVVDGEPVSTDLMTADVETSEAPTAKVDARSQYLRELRTVEHRVHGLKEKVFQSKATLELLRELVIEGASIGATLRITHLDALSRAYKVESINYYLDGSPVWGWKGAEGEDAPEEADVRDDSIQSGQHSLQVSLVVRGNGDVFPYLSDYRVTVESSYSFDVVGGNATDLTVKLVSKGGVRKRFVERPTVVYEERRDTVAME